MTYHPPELMAMINFAICTAIGWACICRLNSTVSRKFRSARTRYALLLAGATASGCSPIFFQMMPSMGEAIFSGAVLVSMVINVPRWRGRRKEDITCNP